MSNEKKTYVGGGKKTQEFARKISICLSDLPKEHIFEYKGKKYMKFEVLDKREPDQYGKDVSVAIDTWKPDGNKMKPTEMPTPEPESDLPF